MGGLESKLGTWENIANEATRYNLTELFLAVVFVGVFSALAVRTWGGFFFIPGARRGCRTPVRDLLLARSDDPSAPFLPRRPATQASNHSWHGRSDAGQTHDATP